MFVPKLKKLPQGNTEISRSGEWDGRADGQTDEQMDNPKPYCLRPWLSPVRRYKMQHTVPFEKLEPSDV